MLRYPHIIKRRGSNCLPNRWMTQGAAKRTERGTAADDANRGTASVQLVDDELDEQHRKHRERQLGTRLHDEVPDQRWPIVDRQPALAHAALIIARLSSVAGGVAVVTPAIATATAMNVIASSTTIVSSPPSPTAIPPSGAPTSREIEPPVANAALADTSWSSLTTRGTSANDAGLLTCCKVACAAATRNTIQTRSRDAASNGSSVSACRTLVATIVRRRSQRSASAPP